MKVIVDIPDDEFAEYFRVLSDKIRPSYQMSTEAMRYIINGEFVTENDEKGDTQ